MLNHEELDTSIERRTITIPAISGTPDRAHRNRVKTRSSERSKWHQIHGDLLISPTNGGVVCLKQPKLRLHRIDLVHVPLLASKEATIPFNPTPCPLNSEDGVEERISSDPSPPRAKPCRRSPRNRTQSGTHAATSPISSCSAHHTTHGTGKIRRARKKVKKSRRDPFRFVEEGGRVKAKKPLRKFFRRRRARAPPRMFTYSLWASNLSVFGDFKSRFRWIPLWKKSRPEIKKRKAARSERVSVEPINSCALPPLDHLSGCLREGNSEEACEPDPVVRAEEAIEPSEADIIWNTSEAIDAPTQPDMLDETIWDEAMMENFGDLILKDESEAHWKTDLWSILNNCE